MGAAGERGTRPRRSQVMTELGRQVIDRAFLKVAHSKMLCLLFCLFVCLEREHASKYVCESVRKWVGRNGGEGERES